MKIIVCGGREYGDRARVFAVLDELHLATPIAEIAQGGATGADALAAQWAKDRSIPCSVFYAQWYAEGRAAGPRRNQRMLDEVRPALVVAFPGGRGTTDMIRRAEAAGVQVHRVG